MGVCLQEKRMLSTQPLKKRKVFRHLSAPLCDMHYGEDDIIEL